MRCRLLIGGQRDIREVGHAIRMTTSYEGHNTPFATDNVIITSFNVASRFREDIRAVLDGAGKSLDQETCEKLFQCDGLISSSDAPPITLRERFHNPVGNCVMSCNFR